MNTNHYVKGFYNHQHPTNIIEHQIDLKVCISYHKVCFLDKLRFILNIKINRNMKMIHKITGHDLEMLINTLIDHKHHQLFKKYQNLSGEWW